MRSTVFVAISFVLCNFYAAISFEVCGIRMKINAGPVGCSRKFRRVSATSAECDLVLCVSSNREYK